MDTLTALEQVQETFNSSSAAFVKAFLNMLDDLALVTEATFLAFQQSAENEYFITFSTPHAKGHLCGYTLVGASILTLSIQCRAETILLYNIMCYSPFSIVPTARNTLCRTKARVKWYRLLGRPVILLEW